MYRDPGWAYIAPAFARNTVHFIGLLSSGGVHSRVNQLEAMLERAAADGAKRPRVPVLTDGRDVPDGTPAGYVAGPEAFRAGPGARAPGASSR